MRAEQQLEDAHNMFDQSIGDLMAGLLLVFVLLLSAALLRLENEFDSRVKFAEEYQILRMQLYEELYNEFKDDLPKWQAVLDKNSLSLRFNEPDVLFDQGKDQVKGRFSLIIKDFFPRYIDILYSDSYRGSIEEIRIEGHTSSEWSQSIATAEEAYFKNMELSQNRTRNVLKVSLSSIANAAKKKWAQGIITANGLSSSQLIFTSGKEDKKASRRVEFRVRTNAETKVSEFLSIWGVTENER